MLKKSGNFWAENIQKMVDSKIHKKITNKAEIVQIQRVYMTNCQNIIRNIIKSNPKSRIFGLISTWLNVL